MRTPSSYLPALLLVLCAPCVVTGCGDDADGSGDATSGADETRGGDTGDGNAGGANTGDADDQEGGAVAADDDVPTDIGNPEPDAGSDAPVIDEPRVDSLDTGDGPFDLELCKTVTFDPEVEEGEQVARCAECCALRAYTLARFVFEETCACARRPRFEDDTVCSGSAGSTEDCGGCCVRAGFAQGTAGDRGCLCTRSPVSDTGVCAGALDDDEPQAACEGCCLEHELFGFMLSSEPGECRCIEPG